MITDPVIAVARLVERLLAEMSCAQDRSELFDLERHATEVTAALPSPHNERLSERITEAVREWLESHEIRRETSEPPVLIAGMNCNGKNCT